MADDGATHELKLLGWREWLATRATRPAQRVRPGEWARASRPVGFRWE
jgi:hypothetical protein